MTMVWNQNPPITRERGLLNLEFRTHNGNAMVGRSASPWTDLKDDVLNYLAFWTLMFSNLKCFLIFQCLDNSSNSYMSQLQIPKLSHAGSSPWVWYLSGTENRIHRCMKTYKKNKKNHKIYLDIRYILDIVRSFGQYNHIKFFNFQFLALWGSNILSADACLRREITELEM